MQNIEKQSPFLVASLVFHSIPSIFARFVLSTASPSCENCGCPVGYTLNNFMCPTQQNCSLALCCTGLAVTSLLEFYEGRTG